MAAYEGPIVGDSTTHTAAMACRPVKHEGVDAQPLEDGDLLLTYRVAVRPWLERLLRRLGRGDHPPPRRKVQLDALGAQVWGWIDGERSVDGIVRAFSEAHRLSHREAELSVTAFLRMLGKRGLIGMREPQCPSRNGVSLSEASPDYARWPTRR
jgi:hypothetical protein